MLWPPYCPQNNLHQYDYLTKLYTYRTSEDCLFLNIWTGHRSLVGGGGSEAKEDELLPVIIYVHGGAFSYMGISMQAYYGGVVAALGRVVYVTLNYRLGLFGFFNAELDDESVYTKNAGLYDQIAAIEWIRANIHHFGGKSAIAHTSHHGQNPPGQLRHRCRQLTASNKHTGHLSYTR